jgi:hypothetical protein
VLVGQLEALGLGCCKADLDWFWVSSFGMWPVWRSITTQILETSLHKQSVSATAAKTFFANSGIWF